MFKIKGHQLADKGYYINLDRSLDRRENIQTLMSKFEIEGLDRFPALTDEWTQFSCTKSHLKVFEESLSKNYEIIFVAEDDMDIREFINLPYSVNPVSFDKILTEICEELKNLEWDVVIFGCNPKCYLIPISRYFAEVNKSTGAWAYLIKKNAYDYVLKNLNYHRDLLAIDDFLPKLNQLGFKTLCTIPMTIHHSIGFESTLQPRGPVNYDSWINGNYQKFLFDFYYGDPTTLKFEKDVTIVIVGHYSENFLFYLNYLIYSLPEKLKKCRFIINYDENSSSDIRKNRFDIFAYFRDRKSEMNVDINFTNGGLISSLDNALNKIKTPFFIFLEHDWVFLNNSSIDFDSLLEAFYNHNFINAVWFSKDDNQLRGFEIAEDIDRKVTPFELEKRVAEVNLVTTCRWSNNPVMFRTEKMKYWFDTIVRNEFVGKTNQGPHNVEESIIPYYRKLISENKWENIKDEWGTYLYGNIGDGPYVGHTDASKRYQGSNKSQPEINGENYIKNNPIVL